jgi:uncharacterized protein with GYD domain
MYYRKFPAPLRYGFYVLYALLLLSCTQPKHCKTPEELGKTVFDLFQKQEAAKLKSYLLGKSEVEKAFGSSEQFQSLTDEEKKIFVSSTYERNKEIGESWIDFYTGKDKPSSALLKTGKYENTEAAERKDNGTTVARIVVRFNENGNLHVLTLNAAKVKDYWKLLSWIEVK